MTPGPHSTRPRAERQAARALAVDHIDDAYGAAFPHKEGQLAAGEWLIERLRPGARVLDVGCGTGVPTARQLADAGCDVTGIDVSEGMLELARREVPKATFLRLDVSDVPDECPSRRGFDAIVAFFSLLMLPRMEIPVTLRRVHDLLEPGGYFLLGMLEAELDDVPVGDLDRALRVTGYPGAELRALVGAAGFEVLDLRHLSYAPVDPEMPPEVQLFLYSRRPPRSRVRNRSRRH
ncbi:MAG TPA: class I SAM-dependent methyltransferase [Streptosporangiaceae bacterium]